MKKKFPIRTFALMITATVMLIFMMGSAFAQVQISNDCPDKCESSTFYTKGVWDEKLEQCVYGSQESCEYGCKIGNTPECKDFPDEPPTDVAEFDETLWNMQKWLYDKEDREIAVSVHGTEYIGGENGTIFLQLLDSNRNIIEDGFCELTVYRPNETLKFLDRIPTSYLENGIYFRDVFVPEDEGVYMIYAYCYYSSEQYVFYLPYNLTWNGNLYEDSSGDPIEVEHTDCMWFQTESGDIQEFLFNDTLIGNINLSTITSLDVVFTLQHEKTIDYDIWNYNTSSWDEIGDDGVAGSVEDSCGNVHGHTWSVTSNIWDYVNGNEVLVRLDMDDDGKVFTDEVTLIFHNNGSVISDIRGSGELHVSNIPFETYMTFSTMPEPILESNHDYCIDNTTLGKTLIWEVCIDNKCDNVARNETITCNYGCYNDACNPEPIDKFIMMLIFLFVVVIVIVVIALAYNKWG